MYCGQCGKRVLDSMLFCPFCGAPIVIPEQDDAVPPAKVSPEPAPEPKPEIPASEPPRETEPEPVVEPESEPEPEAAIEQEPAPEPEPVSEPEPEEAVEDEPAPPVPERSEEDAAPGRPVSLFDYPDDAEESEEIEGSQDVEEPEDSDGFGDSDDFDEGEASGVDSDEADDSDAQDWPEVLAAKGEHFSPLEIGDAVDSEEEAFRLPPRTPPRRSAPRRSAPPGNGRRANRTFIPVRDVDPEDMFMAHIHPSPDETDPYDKGGAPAQPARENRARKEQFPFEESEPEDFLQRHIRGVVGLALLLALVAVLLVWMVLPPGQRVLASANLAWNPRTYNMLGNEAHEAGQYRRAATCYERAFARDEDNYQYAYNAMVAYFEAGDTESSLAMLKRCIDMKPDDPGPYKDLKTLYPDASTRPWEVQQLLRQGYERTGDPELNEIGE